MKDFTPLQRDGLLEIFNIALSKSAASLSELVQKEIHLGVPDLEFIEIEDLTTRLGNFPDGLTTVVIEDFQTINGSGRIFLLFPEKNGLEVVRLMLDVSSIGFSFSEYEQEALIEIGNIVLNYCISTISDVVNYEFQCSIPEYKYGNLHEIVFSKESINKLFILVRIHMSIVDTDISGYVIFLSDLTLVEKLLSEFLKNVQ